MKTGDNSNMNNSQKSNKNNPINSGVSAGGPVGFPSPQHAMQKPPSNPLIYMNLMSIKTDYSVGDERSEQSSHEQN